MTADQAMWRRRAFEATAVLARWTLGALFVYMGLKKAMHPEEFLKLTRQYEMVQSPILLNLIAAGLPWFEAFCGALLLLGIAVRGTALTLVAVLVPFTWLVWRRALALQALRSIPFCAVKFDCGCGAGEVFICGKLAENILLILVSCWLLSGVGRAFCARHALFSGRSGTEMDP
ncbi:MAG: MauE/DoxX family redox-associated membrane protein [Limisphaerales bacterium]